MTLHLRVTRADALAADVRRLILTSIDGSTLPSFTPGSHIGVECGEGRRNSYSLTGPTLEPDHYAISVRLDPDGLGGSRWLHDVTVGQTISAALPRSDFAPVLNARHHVLIAGGIGITPILSHARAAAAWGRSCEVHYAVRRDRGTHVAELRDLCGDRMTVYPGRDPLWSALDPALRQQPLGTHLYTCGPASMIDEVTQRAAAAGWPTERVHTERFTVADFDPGAPYAAKLARSGTLVPVAPGETLLEALLARGIEVANLCRQGVCGECRLPVRGGRIEHRDHYLSDDERSTGEAIMACVSRAAGEQLELDL
jgi:dimethylamine monooxygenase subunit B